MHESENMIKEARGQDRGIKDVQSLAKTKEVQTEFHPMEERKKMKF